MSDSKIKKMVLTALLAALTCVATMIIQIPSPMNGYVNLVSFCSPAGCSGLGSDLPPAVLARCLPISSLDIHIMRPALW